MATIEREEWERDAFDNLEEMCARHANVAPPSSNERPNARTASQGELAAGMREMPVWDDDVWCPRLA
ncbi:MAG TPA: hypothetical protein VML75_17280 [Kofleriaceae bacterium]|nr:hypothetical protein [Kofleriaceae bacterium]